VYGAYATHVVQDIIICHHMIYTLIYHPVHTHTYMHTYTHMYMYIYNRSRLRVLDRVRLTVAHTVMYIYTKLLCTRIYNTQQCNIQQCIPARDLLHVYTHITDVCSVYIYRTNIYRMSLIYMHVQVRHTQTERNTMQRILCIYI
jgi:hypothetical protein